MSTEIKAAVQYAKVNGVMQKIHAITSLDAVGQTFNEDGTVDKTLTAVLEEFTTALAEKAKSVDVTQEIQNACDKLYRKIIGLADGETTFDEAYDTLKEFAEWITGHGEAAAALTNDVAGLKASVEQITQQLANLKSTEIEASNVNGHINVDGKDVTVYENPGSNVFVATTEEEVTAAEEKMQDGDVLFRIV